MDWLEGDVSTSAARRLVLPRMFQNIDAILSNWYHLAGSWLYDRSALSIEVDRYAHQLATSALLQAAIEAGASRQGAYEAIVQASENPDGWGRWSDTLSTFRLRLGSDSRFPLTHEQIRRVIAELLDDRRVGHVQEQIEQIERRANLVCARWGGARWEPEEPR